MGLMEKSEKLAEAMTKFKIKEDGEVDLELLTKEEMLTDIKLISEIAIIMATKLVQVDNEVAGWEYALDLIQDVDSPFFEGAKITLENNIKTISDVMDADI